MDTYVLTKIEKNAHRHQFYDSVVFVEEEEKGWNEAYLDF